MTGSRNTIYYNEFYYNNGSGDSYDPSKIQAYDGGSNNLWNLSGYGNYWHDWAMNNNTNDIDNNGIVDFPYKIDGPRETETIILSNQALLYQKLYILFQ